MYRLKSVPRKLLLLSLLCSALLIWATLWKLAYQHFHFHYVYVATKNLRAVYFDGELYSGKEHVRIRSYWGSRELVVVYESGKVIAAEVACSPFDEDSDSISIDDKGIHSDTLLLKVTELRSDSSGLLSQIAGR